MAPSAKILPVRVLDRDGRGTSANVAKGILYAASHGAKVITMSFGSTQQSTAMQTAVAEAIKKNVLVVAAAGNRGCGLLGAATEYPAAYSGVVGVGAVTQSTQPRVVLELRLLGRRRGTRRPHHLDDDPQLRRPGLLLECRLLHALRDVVLHAVRCRRRSTGHLASRVEPVDGRQPAPVDGHRPRDSWQGQHTGAGFINPSKLISS